MEEGVVPAIDLERAQEYALRVWKYKQGEMVSLMVHLGDRLGLFATLASGPHTSDELAEAHGLDERWVREWLDGVAAADLIERSTDAVYSMSPEAASVLVDENSLMFATGAFAGGTPPEMIDRIVGSFRSGVGFTYADMGAEMADQIDRMNHANLTHFLVPVVVPMLGDVVGRLEAGGTIVDIGCGGGVAVAALADRFPNARVIGYDQSEFAVARAGERLADVPNAEVHLAGSATPPDGSVDLVMTLDVIHDLTHPDRMAAEISRLLAADGTWLVKDIRCSGDFETDRKNPVHAMQYGYSLMSCLASSTAEPGGAGLGTLGLSPAVLADLTTAAGFSRQEQLRTPDPAHLYYAVRR